MKTIYSIAALFLSASSFAQLKSVDTPYPPVTYRIPVEASAVAFSNTYDRDTRAAAAALKSKDYATAAQLYEQAFSDNNNLGIIEHRYKAACALAAIGNNDKAFEELKRIAKSGHFFNIEELESEKLLKPLHIDQRWEEVTGMVRASKQRFIDDLNEKEKLKAEKEN